MPLLQQQPPSNHFSPPLLLPPLWVSTLLISNTPIASNGLFGLAPQPPPCSRQPDKSLKSVISSNFSSSFPNLPRASCCTGLQPPDLLVGPPVDELCQPQCLDFCHLLSWCSFCQSQDLTRLSVALCQQSLRQRWLSPFCFRSLPGTDPTWHLVTHVSCRPPPT